MNIGQQLDLFFPPENYGIQREVKINAMGQITK